jgi:GNAT superfamily N-acetyltransferase
MMGPMNPSTNDEVGFLCEGFDLPPSLMMAYTPKYYLRLAEAVGLVKIKELYAYDMDVKSDDRVGRLARVVQMAKRKMPGLIVRPIDFKNFTAELNMVMSVYNRAWDKNWGFVPWTDAEFEDLAKRLKPLIDPNLAVVAIMQGAPVGMLVASPDYNVILKKINGHMLPFGFLKFLYYRNQINALRLLIMGVVKEYRNKGIEAIMYSKTLDYAIRKGYKHCELSWVLDDNIPTQRTSEMMGGKIYKRYAVFEGRF